jgi:hypothetical protein
MPGEGEDGEPEQILRVGVLDELTLQGLLKLDFIKKCTDGLRKRLRRLNEV